MNINKAIAPILASIALGVVAMVPSIAAPGDQKTFASATGAGDGGSTVFTYTGGPTGAFTTTVGAQFQGTFISTASATFPATLTFTGFSASGIATGAGTGADPFHQELSAGTFTLNDGTTTLLSGSFTGGNLLTVASGSTTASITNKVNNVTYTGGSYFLKSGLLNPGSFSISMTSVSPSPKIGTDGYLSAFKAAGSGTFSAKTPAAVPEPATVAPFIMGGLGLMGLAFRARKTRRSNGAAA